MNLSVYKNLFSTPIMLSTLERNFTETEIQCIRNLKLISNNLNLRSEDSYILNNDCLVDVKAFIDSNVKKYFKEIYKPKENLDIYITQSWINVSRVGERHNAHTHPNSFVSGTLYISADREVDCITFVKPDNTTIKLIPEEYNDYNCSSWFFNVGIGDIVLFPSSLGHYVDPVRESNGRVERISLSFNTFLKGIIGADNFLSELKL